MNRLLIKSLALTAQVHLPLLADAKAKVLSWYRQGLRRPRGAAMRALMHFDLAELGEVLDVGSAYGESTATLRALAPRARLVAIEPNAFYVNKVRARFRLDPLFSARQCAISDVDGPLPLYLPAYGYTLFPDLATLDRQEAETWLATRILGYDPLRLSVVEMPAQSHTLDSLGLSPSFIRIDARCDASAVIMGGAATMTRNRPLITLESARLSPPCTDLLQSLGYRNFRPRDNHLVTAPWEGPADLLLQEAHLGLWRGRGVPQANPPTSAA